jgi:hypothetical protein
MATDNDAALCKPMGHHSVAFTMDQCADAWPEAYPLLPFATTRGEQQRCGLLASVGERLPGVTCEREIP